MRLALFVLLSFLSVNVVMAADKPVFELAIKDHKFEPSTLRVPAGQAFTLNVHNQDATPEEFESHDFKREKIIAGNSKAIIHVGALKKGTHKFFGEFNPKTAQGKIIAE